MYGLEIFSNYSKRVETKIHVSGANSQVCRSYRGKTDTGEGGGLFFPSASGIGLKCNDTVFHDGGRYHVEISPLICHANQSTGFYMITASVMKELKMIVYTSELLNLSVETMNSVVDDIIYLSPCRSVLKILSSIFLIFIKTSCLAD